jgi:hypothetical protein
MQPVCPRTAGALFWVDLADAICFLKVKVKVEVEVAYKTQTLQTQQSQGNFHFPVLGLHLWF